MTDDPRLDDLTGTETLGLLLRRAARRWPERPALMAEVGPQGRDLAWADLDAAVDRCVAAWTRAGVKPGDGVAFLCEKRPEVVVGLLACARMGAIYLPVNHKLPVEQVQDLLVTAGASTLLFEVAMEGIARALRPLVARSLPLEAMADAPPAPAHDDVTDADTPCYDNLTSGSTGRPKVARTTHRQIVANATSTLVGLGFESDDTYLGMFSVFAHPHELFHRSLLLGGAFVITDSVTPRVVADVIRRRGVRWVMAVPSFYEMLLDHLRDGGAPMPSLRVLEAGGAYVSPQALARMEAGFGASFLPVWGSTEATGVGLGMPAGASRAPGSTGRPMPGLRAVVVDEDGAAVPDGVVGELVLAGAAIAGGYVGQPEETAARFRTLDGVRALHTQDLFRRDGDGWFWFVGRRHDMLKIGGIRVYPLEIELALAEHPAIRAAVVVRAEDRIRGEVARAILEVDPAHPGAPSLGVRAVQAWCRARLATYKVPRIVEFWRVLPRLPNGKLDRAAILAVPVDPSRDERS